MRLGGGGFGNNGGGDFDVRSLAPPLLLFVLFASGAAWWLFNGFFLLVFVLPALVVPLVQWYVSNNLLEGSCPDCAAPVQAFKGQQAQCFSCGAVFSSELSPSGVFMRQGAQSRDSGVVDIDIEID